MTNIEGMPLLPLLITDQEYSYIISLLKHYQAKIDNPDINLAWYDFEYIIQALEFAREEGEGIEVNQ